MAVARHFLFWIAFFVVASPTAGDNENSLRFVTALWRHGDRSPSGGTFPTDTQNGDETWPQGFGELMQMGMRQHQHLGAYLRQRYVIDYNFLSPNYSTKEIYIRSTGYNRTIMSALSNMAGMYPIPDGVDMLENVTLWQPIPIHSQPRETDPMLWMDCPCPKVTDIYWNEVMTSDPVQQIEAENKDFLNFLLNETGMSQMTLDDVWDVWDPLNCEKIYNDSHTWPDWVTEPIFEQLTDLMNVGTVFYYNDPKIQRFRGSLLFNDIAIRFDQKANRSEEIQPPQLKYYVYSVHDTTIAALLENMGAYDAHLPEYASAVLFELHEKQPQVFTVETYYVNETWASGPPVRLVVKGCDDQQGGVCDLKTFVKIAGSNVPDDWYAECQDTNSTVPKTTEPSFSSTMSPQIHPDCDNKSNAATIAAIVLGVTTGIFLLAFLVTLFLYCNLKKRSKIGQRTY